MMKELSHVTRVMQLLISCVTLILLSSCEDVKNTANLYPASGPVVNVEADNFYAKIANSDHNWVVLFYLSWCGHCIDYVPTYKSIAVNLKGFSQYIQISAINCAKEANGDVCRDHGVTEYPTLKFIPQHTEDTKPSKYLIDEASSHNFTQLHSFIVEKLKGLNIQLPPLGNRPVTLSQVTRSTIEPLLKHTGASNKYGVIVTSSNSSILFYEDLLFALRYSLNTEVGGHLDITGESLESLKLYLLTLYKYFPRDDDGVTNSLSTLYSRVSTHHSKHISSSLWTKMLEETGILRLTKSKAHLVRCRGSSPKFRGYPCTLWSLFHTLTVRASVNDTSHLSTSVKKSDTYLACQVLDAMTSYVKHFFTCADCRTHFLAMAAEISSAKFKSSKDCVLWLWRAHNKANKRLAGEASEDPEFPKLQFPDKKSCSECRSLKGFWNEQVVYGFLLSTYIDLRHRHREVTAGIRTTPVHHLNGWKSRLGFNTVDMSLCYMIYISSILVIAGIFYCVVIRQRLYLRMRKPNPAIADRHIYKPIY